MSKQNCELFDTDFTQKRTLEWHWIKNEPVKEPLLWLNLVAKHLMEAAILFTFDLNLTFKVQCFYNVLKISLNNKSNCSVAIKLFFHVLIKL